VAQHEADQEDAVPVDALAACAEPDVDTEALLSAVPIPDPDLARQWERIVLEGDVPSPIDPPTGCRFYPRCRYATDVCKEIEPPLVDYGGGHLAACHHPLNIDPEQLRDVTVATNTPAAADESALPQESSGRSDVVGGATPRSR
jgi:oligopeptide/dipeptide ABC transporter ATP-binding protein